ncbi:DUF6349 family protein [Nonomuraea sp. M3C6]|uniref:DUF6349 family protein n=1 Tax=Nonomuraea marmarensis TaxID=3351344 RepID=A0ABW7AP56_9ACTN
MGNEPRGAVAREAAVDQAPADQQRGMWRIYITHPGARTSRVDPAVTSTAPEHRPTVLFRVVDEPKWHQLYRGGCLGCDWEGPETASESKAVEDAHDHTWPGWRDLPAVQQPKTNYERWLAEIRRAYPPGWLEAGGPIVTIRSDSRFSRHMPGKAPGGGYDLAATYYQAKKQRNNDPQPTLDLEFP